MHTGVADDSEIIGINNLDEELTRLSNMMRDPIRPDTLMNCSTQPESIDGKNVILVHVERGTKRPYYLTSKGPRPEGVFIRSGAATLPSSESGILHMIQQSEQDTFESYPSTIKTALFSDDERTAFTFREEYSGSILKQLADAYSFLERNSRNKMSFDGLERMRNGYSDSGAQPTIRITPNTFTVELPNHNAPRPKLASEADSDVEVRSILGNGKTRSRKKPRRTWCFPINGDSTPQRAGDARAREKSRRRKNTRYTISR